MTRRFSRRELGALVGGAALAKAARGLAPESSDRADGRGIVGVARLRPDDNDRNGAPEAAAAVGAALTAATGSADGAAAVRSLFSPSDVVGVKLNCLGGKRLSPRPPVVRDPLLPPATLRERSARPVLLHMSFRPR